MNETLEVAPKVKSSQTKKSWDDIIKEYGKSGFTNARHLAKWLKENYESPKSKK
tara:strand:+ start:157 stop:318 length:162 start_codon:yes stop_codon:yes gene_type:complete